MAKLRLLTSVAVMVAMVMAALPATAFAHTKATVSCTLAVQVVAPGVDVVKAKKNHFDIRNSGQVLAGVLLCGDPALDGIVSTLHSSKVKDKGKTGAFEGKIKGELTLMRFSDSAVLTGKLKAKVSGMMAVPGDPTTVFTETITGKLKLKGVDIKVKVEEFSITLTPDVVRDVPVTGTPFPGPIPTLAGATTLEGELKTDD